jgi:CRP-like cAMP-binding protein
MNATLVKSRHPLPSPTVISNVVGGVDLFEMLSSEDLERVIAAGEVYRLEQGDYLFKAGDPPDSIHVILAGAIEVVRSTPDNPQPTPVAYLSPGEAIGDMGLFTGTARRSAGRAPEFADVITLTRSILEELTYTVPGYGLEIAAVFARRLDAFIKRMRGQKRRKELSGRLRFFDLPTVLQTLVQSKQTGVLTITDDEGETYAEVLLLDGSVARAHCGMAEGEEAFYQLFHKDDQGEFFFRSILEPDADSISEVVISRSAMNLLLEAMRRIDEFPFVRNRLEDPERPFRARTETLQWEEEATQAIAQEVLDKLRAPRLVADLIDDVPCSTFTLYRIAAELFESDQIG